MPGAGPTDRASNARWHESVDAASWFVLDGWENIDTTEMMSNQFLSQRVASSDYLGYSVCINWPITYTIGSKEVLKRPMNALDPQERAIVRALIRHPRRSDNSLASDTGVPVRTVRRKRRQLEASGRLRYYTALDTRDAESSTQHMIILKFRLGVTRAQVEEEIRSEPNVANVFAELIRDSYLAELDGHVSLVMVLEGESDADVIDSLQGKIVPSLKKNHGEDSIVELRTMRVLGAIRREHNYVPDVNMEGAYLTDGWPDEAIYVGEEST